MTPDVKTLALDDLVDGIKTTERRMTADRNWLGCANEELLRRGHERNLELLKGMDRDQKYRLMKLLHAQGVRV